jgi:hypothetical protein
MDNCAIDDASISGTPDVSGTKSPNSTKRGREDDEGTNIPVDGQPMMQCDAEYETISDEVRIFLIQFVNKG